MFQATCLYFLKKCNGLEEKLIFLTRIVPKKQLWLHWKIHFSQRIIYVDDIPITSMVWTSAIFKDYDSKTNLHLIRVQVCQSCTHLKSGPLVI